MRSIYTLLLFIFIVQIESGCAQTESYIFPDEDWEEWDNWDEAGYNDSNIRELQNWIIDSMNTTGLVVVVGGKVLAAYGDIEELSYLASCRKSILAMLYGKYVEDGTIDLEKSLADLKIDDVQGLQPIEKQATIHHLIMARSGIYHPASNGGDNSADAPERGSQKPGEYFLYNNWDFNAAGAVFEMLTQQTVYEALEKDLAIPIGMQDWDIDAQRKSGNVNRSKFRAYHIWLSTRDMARIGYLMLRDGNWKGKQVVSKDWTKQIISVVTPLAEMNPPRYRDGYFGYGYMWWLWQGKEATGPFEGAYSARGAWGQYITVLPKLDMVIAHKTKAEYRRRTNWGSYERLLKYLVDAKSK